MYFRTKFCTLSNDVLFMLLIIAHFPECHAAELGEKLNIHDIVMCVCSKTEPNTDEILVVTQEIWGQILNEHFKVIWDARLRPKICVIN